MSFRSAVAIENFHAIGEKYLSGNFSLQIIDISIEKERAIEYQIVVIPTLIRVNPS
ncbi:MAG: circadian clock protein KaiB, partial [Flavobacterium sp.]